MSILIKGVEMPKCCADCFLEDPYDGYNCRIALKSVNWGLGERPSWCPLVELPTSHGDLIDRDSLMLRINIHGTNKFGMLDEDIRQFVNAAPTIIPASEKET